MAQITITLQAAIIGGSFTVNDEFTFTPDKGEVISGNPFTYAELRDGKNIVLSDSTATELTVSVSTTGGCTSGFDSIPLPAVTTATPTPTPTATSTPTPTPTNAPATPTPTPTVNTPTPTATPTDTPTPTPTVNTPTPTPTLTNTPTPTPTTQAATETPTPTPTSTPVPCLTYDIDNYDQVQNLLLSYTDCNDGQVKQATFYPDSSYYLCSTTTPVRSGGSNSYQISTGYADSICNSGTSGAQPTPTPTPTPVPLYGFTACDGGTTVYQNLTVEPSSGDRFVDYSGQNPVYYVYNGMGIVYGVTPVTSNLQLVVGEIGCPQPATPTPTPTPQLAKAEVRPCSGGPAEYLTFSNYSSLPDVTPNAAVSIGGVCYEILTANYTGPIDDGTVTGDAIYPSGCSDSNCSIATPTPTPQPATATPTPTPTVNLSPGVEVDLGCPSSANGGAGCSYTYVRRDGEVCSGVLSPDGSQTVCAKQGTTPVVNGGTVFVSSASCSQNDCSNL